MIHLFRVFKQPLDDLRAACIRSVIRQNTGHVIVLWHNSSSDMHWYDDFPDIINSTEHRFVNEEFPDAHMSIDNASKLIQQTNGYRGGSPLATYSDLVRIEILHKYGGWWIDDDVFMLKPLPNATGFMCAAEFNWCSSFKHKLIPSNFVLYNRFSEQFSEYRDYVHQRLFDTTTASRSYIEFGPLALRTLFEQGKTSERNMFDMHTFYAPFNINRSEFVDDASFDALTRIVDSVGLHITSLTSDYKVNSIVGLLETFYNSDIPGDAYEYLKLRVLFNHAHTMNTVKRIRQTEQFDVLEWNEIRNRTI